MIAVSTLSYTCDNYLLSHGRGNNSSQRTLRLIEVMYMGSEHTSDIQKRIFEFIVEYIRNTGMSPTNREIGSAMSIASTGHVDYHLSMLEKKGI